MSGVQWNEDAHPRDAHGRFTSGGGGEGVAARERMGRVASMFANAHRSASRVPIANSVEAVKQQKLAEAQTNPLAHPPFVLGMDNDLAGETGRYIAAYGQEFKAMPLPDDVRAGQMGECYKNASLLVVGRQDLTYAEGFATTDKSGLAFMHGWAVDKDNNVIDPTWPDGKTYFGVKYDREAYLKELYTAKFYGVTSGKFEQAQANMASGAERLRAKEERPSSMLDKTPDAFPKLFPEGRDTREQFSDGKGNYSPERTALHDEIIAKYMAGTTAVEKPTAMILGGGMGSGKTTLVEAEHLAKGNTVDVNVDKIRSDLPEVKGMIARGEKMNVALAHEEASDIGGKILRQAVEGKRNLTLDGTGDTTLEKLGGKIALMRRGGHETVGEYVTLPVAVAQERADARAEKTDRRFVPPTAMKEVHAAVSRIFPEAVKQGLFDRARLWDTHVARGERPRLIASSKGRSLTVHDQKAWDSFVAKGTATTGRGPHM